MILAADFSFGFDPVRPVNHQVILLTATVFALLEIAERRIAGHGPARVVVRVGVLAAPVFLGAKVGFQRRL